MRKPIFLTLLCLCLMGVFASASWAQLPAPAAHWPLDGDGSDISGNGYDAIEIGGDAALQTGGVYGGYIQFNGAGWMDVPVAVWNDHVVPNQAFTICFWYSVDLPLSNNVAFASSTGTDRMLQSHLPWPSNEDIYFDYNGRTNIDFAANGGLYSVWQHWTYQYTPGTGRRMLLNGVEIMSVADADAMIAHNNFVFGANQAHGTGSSGAFDDIRVYDVILTDEQIQLVMEGPDAHKPIVDAGPDQASAMPDDTVTLDAYIQDDGDPNGVLKYWWEVTSKPAAAACDVDPPGPITITVEPGGDVEPNQPYALDPEVTVDQAGVYELKLTARDEEQDTNDTVKVTVYPADYLGLVAHWKLDEGAGKVAEDAAGNFYVPNEETHEFDQLECPGDVINGYGGTEDPNWIDGPNWENSGLLIEPNDFEEAIELDSNIQQYIAISNLHYEGAGLEACAVTAWIKTDSGGNQVIASFDRNQYWRLEVNGDSGGEGQIGWGVMTSDGQAGVSSVRRVDDNAWHHVAGVFDNGTLSIYIDGTEDASTTGGSTFGSAELRYGFVGVGSEAEEYDGDKAPLSYFHGGIDDVRIYNIALTPDDIRDVSRVGNAPPVAYAGSDKRLIKDPDGDAIVLDDASVVDIPGNVDVEWTATGPGTVLFSGGPVNATAIFDGSSFGLYELTITATDQAEDEWESSDSLCIMYQAKSSYDLVALYTLDESIPNLTAADSSGNGLDGTLSTLDTTDPNLPKWKPADGKIDGALLFDNADPNLDQYVDLSRVPGSDDLTAMFWMKADAVAYMIPLDKLPNDTSGAGWAIKLRNNGETWFRVGSETGAANRHTLDSNNTDYAVGVWNHMACTFDSGTGNAAIYVDGLQVASATNWTTHSANNIRVPLRMGLPNEAQLTERFQGLLDQVRIYDRALSPLEVAKQAIADSLEIDGCQLSIPGSVITGDISGPDGVPDCRVDLFDFAAVAGSWLVDTNIQ